MNPLMEVKFYLNVGHKGRCCKRPHRRLIEAAYCQAQIDVDVGNKYEGEDISPLRSSNKLYILVDDELVEPSLEEKRLFRCFRQDRFFYLVNEERKRTIPV